MSSVLSIANMNLPKGEFKADELDGCVALLAAGNPDTDLSVIVGTTVEAIDCRGNPLADTIKAELERGETTFDVSVMYRISDDEYVVNGVICESEDIADCDYLHAFTGVDVEYETDEEPPTPEIVESDDEEPENIEANKDPVEDYKTKMRDIIDTAADNLGCATPEEQEEVLAYSMICSIIRTCPDDLSKVTDLNSDALTTAVDSIRAAANDLVNFLGIIKKHVSDEEDN